MPSWSACVAFALALALLVLGHLVRVSRWSMLLREAGAPRPAAGFLALSLAYVVDTFAPLRVGELARGVYYAQRTRGDVAHILATIAMERAFDLAVVAMIAAALSDGLAELAGLAWAAAAAAAGVFAAALLVERSARFRRLVWLSAAPFNGAIRLLILDFAWSLSEALRQAGAHAARFAAQSAAMWALYLSSYAVLARVLSTGLRRLFATIHGAPLKPALVQFFEQDRRDAVLLLAYAFAPFALIILYSLAKRRFGLSVWGAVAWLADPELYVRRARHSRSRFSHAELYSGFLARRFSGTASLVSDFEMNAVGGAVVQRLFRGGSEALTALVQVGDELRIRKYATGEAAVKLEAQCGWLARHAGELPLVGVAGQAREVGRFFYDMDYVVTSRDLFDVIHTSGIERSWAIVEDVLGAVSALHARTGGGEATADCVARYAAEKVAANLALIEAAFPPFFDRPVLRINGAEVRTDLLRRFAEPGFMDARIACRATSTIHGDLTIENILADPSRPRGWFLIDPNVGNVFDSPLLDHAKLIQSLHLGYESLNRDIAVEYDGATLTFPVVRTAQYAELHARATAWMRDNLGEQALREARLHEVAHYFRLIPYKFRRSTQAGLVFLGCLAILAQRWLEEFEAC